MHQRTTNVVPFSPQAAELKEAERAARSSMHQFLAAFSNPEPHQTSFHLKVAFDLGGEIYYVWLSEIDLDHGMPTGVIARETGIPGFVTGTRVPFETIRITDWMYSDDNALVGGFTTRALLKLRTRSTDRVLTRTPHPFDVQ